MLKKIIVSFLIFIVFTSVFTTTIFASTKDIDPQVKEAINGFFNCFKNRVNELSNSADDGRIDKSNSAKGIDDYCDLDNKELYNNIEKYINSMSIRYEIQKVSKYEDGYNVEMKIEASGINWKASGFTINCKLKKIGDEYKIVNTNLFDYVGAENVAKFAFNIIGTVFAIIGGIFLSIVIVVIVVVIICVKKKKVNSDENKKEEL